MPPAQTTPANLKKIDKVSVAIHALIASAILADLVFTEITANHGDNDTVYSKNTSLAPSPSRQEKNPNGRPTTRLIIFVSLYVAYLALKAYQLTIDNAWFKYKKWVDEVCVWIGAASLCGLIATTTIVFTTHVAAPVCGALFVLRYVILGTRAHSCLLEFFYVKALQFQKVISFSYYSIKACLCRIRFQSQEVQAAHQEALNAALEVRTQKVNRWNELIQTAKNAAAGGEGGGANGGGSGRGRANGGRGEDSSDLVVQQP